MAKFETKERLVERKTFLTGKLNGKYIGYLDSKDSDRQYENVYSLEILEAEIVVENQPDQILNWKNGEPKEFQDLELFNPKLPETLVLCIKEQDGSVNYFDIHLHDGKFLDIKLSNQVYEGKQVYGDITGFISGYLRHFEVETYSIEINDVDDQSEPDPIIEDDEEPTPLPEATFTRTGKADKQGCYIRYQYYYSDGTTYWGKFQKIEDCKQHSCLESIVQIGIFLLFLGILIPILYYGWKILLIGALIAGMLVLVPSLKNILDWIFTGLVWLYTIVLLLSFVIGIFNLFIDKSERSVQEVVVPKVEEPIVRDSFSDEKDTKKVEDRIISNNLIWSDLFGNEYEMALRVRLTDYRQSLEYRNEYSIQIQNEMDYNALVQSLYHNDRVKLDLIYESLDSIRRVKDLDEIEFAFMVVSMVQDIPYTLLLDKDCDAKSYRDPEIRKLIKEENCEGNIKFGLHSPVEFVGTLKGDCDTRTLLVYTILDHFNYNIAILGSIVYKHSIIGIDLPLNGLRKKIRGRDYVVWETTAKLVPPGLLSPDMSNMRYWNISLISN